MRRTVDKKPRGSMPPYVAAALNSYANGGGGGTSNNNNNNNGGGNTNSGAGQSSQPARVANIGSVGNKMNPVGNGRPAQSLPPPASVAATTSGGTSSSGRGGQRLSNSSPSGSNKKRTSGVGGGGGENLVHLTNASPTAAFSPVLPTGGHRPTRQMSGLHLARGNSYVSEKEKGKRRGSVVEKPTGARETLKTVASPIPMAKEPESVDSSSRDPYDRFSSPKTINNNNNLNSNVHQNSPARVSPLQTIDQAHVHLKGRDIAFLALDLHSVDTRPGQSNNQYNAGSNFAAPGTARSTVSGADKESPRSTDGVSPRAGENGSSTRGTVRPAQRHGKLQSHNKLASTRPGSRPSSGASRKSSFKRGGAEEPFVLPPPAAMQPPVSSVSPQPDDSPVSQQKQSAYTPTLDGRRDDIGITTGNGYDDFSMGSPSLGPQGDPYVSPKPASRKQGNVQPMVSTETSLPKTNSRFNLVRRFSFGKKKRPQSATSQTRAPPPAQALEPPRLSTTAVGDGQDTLPQSADNTLGTSKEEASTGPSGKEGAKSGSRFTKKVVRRSTYGNLPDAGLRSVASGIPYSPFFQPMDNYADMQNQGSYYHYSGMMNSFLSGHQSPDDNYFGFSHNSSLHDDGREPVGEQVPNASRRTTTKTLHGAMGSPANDDLNGSRSPSPVPFEQDNMGSYAPFSAAMPSTAGGVESGKTGAGAPGFSSNDDFGHLSYRDMLAYMDDSIEGFDDINGGTSGYGTGQKSSPNTNGVSKTYTKANTAANGKTEEKTRGGQAAEKTHQPSSNPNTKADSNKANGEAQSRNYRRSRSIHEASETAVKLKPNPNPNPTFSVRPNAQSTRLAETHDTSKPSGGGSFLPRTDKASQGNTGTKLKEAEGGMKAGGGGNAAAPAPAPLASWNGAKEPPSKSSNSTARNPVASLASSLPFHTLQFPMKQSARELSPSDSEDPKSGVLQPSLQSAEPTPRNRITASTAPRKVIQAGQTPFSDTTGGLNSTYETLVLEEIVTDVPPPSSLHTHAPPPQGGKNTDKPTKRYTSPKRKAGGVALTSKYLSAETDLSSSELENIKAPDTKGKSADWKESSKFMTDSFQDLQFDYGNFVDAVGGPPTIAVPQSHQNGASLKPRGTSSDRMVVQRQVSSGGRIDKGTNKDSRSSAEKRPAEAKAPTVMQAMSALAKELAKEIHSPHNSQPRDKDSRDVDKLLNSLRDSLSLDKLSSSHSQSRDDLDRHGTPKPTNTLSRSDVTRHLSTPTKRSPTNHTTTETTGKSGTEKKWEVVTQNPPTPLKTRSGAGTETAVAPPPSSPEGEPGASASTTAGTSVGVASTPNAGQARRTSARHLPPMSERDVAKSNTAGPAASIPAHHHNQPTLQSSHLQEIAPAGANGSMTSPNDLYKGDPWRSTAAHMPSYPKPFTRVKASSMDEGSMRLAPMSKAPATANSCATTPSVSPMFSADESSPPNQNLLGGTRRANMHSAREAFIYDDVEASAVANPAFPAGSSTTDNLDDRTTGNQPVEKSASVPNPGPGLKDLFGAGTARAIRTRSKQGTMDKDANNTSFNADPSAVPSDYVRAERKYSSGDSSFPALPSQGSGTGDGVRSKDFSVSPKHTLHQISPSLSARAKMFEDLGDTDSFFSPTATKPTPKSLSTQSAPSSTTPQTLPPISSAAGSRRSTGTVPAKLGITPAGNATAVEKGPKSKPRHSSRWMEGGNAPAQRSLKQQSDDTLTDDANHLSFRNTEFQPIQGNEDRYAEDSSGEGSGYAGKNTEVVRVEVNSKGLGVSVVDHFGSTRNNNYSVVHSTLSTRYANRSSLSQSLQRSPQTVSFGDTDTPNVDLAITSPPSLGEGQVGLKMLMNVETAQMRHARSCMSTGSQREFGTTAIGDSPTTLATTGDAMEFNRYNTVLSEEQRSELERVLDELKPTSGRMSSGDVRKAELEAAAAKATERMEEEYDDRESTAPIPSSASTRAPSVEMAGAHYKRKNGMKEMNASQIADDVQHLANYYLTSTAPQEKNMANPRSGHLRSSQQCYQESSQLI